jgi:hypothetical protein
MKTAVIGSRRFNDYALLQQTLDTYTIFGKGAPLIRNKDIVEAAKLLIAFWDGESRGTAQAFKYVQSKDKAVIIIRFNNYVYGKRLA